MVSGLCRGIGHMIDALIPERRKRPSAGVITRMELVGIRIRSGLEKAFKPITVGVIRQPQDVLDALLPAPRRPLMSAPPLNFRRLRCASTTSKYASESSSF